MLLKQVLHKHTNCFHSISVPVCLSWFVFVCVWERVRQREREKTRIDEQIQRNLVLENYSFFFSQFEFWLKVNKMTDSLLQYLRARRAHLFVRSKICYDTEIRDKGERTVGYTWHGTFTVKVKVLEVRNPSKTGIKLHYANIQRLSSYIRENTVCVRNTKRLMLFRRNDIFIWNVRNATWLKKIDSISYVYTGCFTTLGHNCRRWFPTFLWSKKFI